MASRPITTATGCASVVTIFRRRRTGQPASTIFRVIEFLPDATWRGKADGKEAFTSIGAARAMSDDPMMQTIVENRTEVAFSTEGSHCSPFLTALQKYSRQIALITAYGSLQL